MAEASSEEWANFLEQTHSGEDLLAHMLGVGSDPVDVRREAVAIGEWAHEFAATCVTRQ